MRITLASDPYFTGDKKKKLVFKLKNDKAGKVFRDLAIETLIFGGARPTQDQLKILGRYFTKEIKRLTSEVKSK